MKVLIAPMGSGTLVKVPRRMAWRVMIPKKIVSMGCGDACPIFPGQRYEDWDLADPAGQDVDAVRSTRDEIERRIRVLLDEIGVPASA